MIFFLPVRYDLAKVFGTRSVRGFLIHAHTTQISLVAARAPPPLVVVSAPVVRAVAVLAGGASYAGVLGSSA